MTYPIIYRGSAPSVWSDVFNTRREIDRMFDRLVGNVSSPAQGTLWAPAVDVKETAEAIEVAAELPGIKPEDVEVSVEHNTLTIAGEKRREAVEGDDGGYRITERNYGRFERSFTLPRGVDAGKVQARFEHGVLTVELPKAEEAKPQRIDVTIGR
ncbi:MAG TPA: Hsp20/alpha crystallin family protein [Gemmatimonadales bacterium]